jgi:hypothetical protein
MVQFRRRLRTHTTKTATKEPTEGVNVELDVSPAWWPYVHHRRNGPFSITVTELLRRLGDMTDVEIVSLSATPESLTVTLRAFRSDAVSDYESIRALLIEHLVASITLEDTDYASAERPAPPEPETPFTRVELEAKLRDLGFIQGAHLGEDDTPQADDADIWTHQSGFLCVQFDASTKQEEEGVARWIDRTGEEKLAFRRITERLQAWWDKHDFEDGIFPATGKANGGIFGTQHA